MQPAAGFKTAHKYMDYIFSVVMRKSAFYTGSSNSKKRVLQNAE
jgi:hypothetical protein